MKFVFSIAHLLLMENIENDASKKSVRKILFHDLYVIQNYQQ